MIVEIVKTVACPLPPGDYITVKNCRKCPYHGGTTFINVVCQYEAEGSIGDAEPAKDKEWQPRW